MLHRVRVLGVMSLITAKDCFLLHLDALGMKQMSIIALALEAVSVLFTQVTG